jgi:hypothetical protein
VAIPDLCQLFAHSRSSVQLVQTIRLSIRPIPTEKTWKPLVLVPVPVRAMDFLFLILLLTFKKEKGNFIIHHIMLDLSC